MGCVFRLGIAQRKRLRSVKNRSAILFWGVRQDARRSKMTVPFERLGLRLLDCEVFLRCISANLQEPHLVGRGIGSGFFCGSLRRDMHRMRVLRALVAIIGTIWRESREMRARGWVLHRKRAHLEHISPSTAEMTRIRRASCHIAVDFPAKGKKHAHCASILPARNAGKWDLSLFSRQAPSTELPLISRIQEMRGSSVLEVFLFAGKLYLGK